MQHVKIYPHNDLLNLAYHQISTIRTKVASREHDGLGLDCLACLISLSFSVEAIINFVGSKRIDEWKERDSYKNKIKRVCAFAGQEFDSSVGIYNVLWQLKELRDSIAHGKPSEQITTDAQTREQLFEQMECPWDKALNPENVEATYKAVQQFKRVLFKGCEIHLIDTITYSRPVAE
ncbi:hypothetical protein VR7878_03808 [Vibrio ruber DSM 16370]|uniref:RiboL-PSP-HEPN domain-containing protein n=1 Tax=Vibrio ruber (strain DSM 16370 / JCM 11486 / BCRC 17186 / CECT 7878 / LMG 23124 / VR1) TaxID=1123498 RepID=A0A1R4LTS7_VIBR1|nr:hypothetical protein [Vibrio ruber]SJN59908.1 hypothetical protein VR7878_03808 [Vibrio ruber DSM 16370]